MRGKHMVLNCNVTDSKDDPPLLKPKTVIREDPFKPMPVTTTESVINKLPIEILAYIFCKFPASYMYRLRCVCKLWDLLMRESSFIEQHFNNRASGKDPGIISLSSPCQIKNQGQVTSNSIKVYEEGSSFTIHHEIDMSKYLMEPYYKMTNSCHGLICVIGLVNIIVMNPSIGRLRALPVGRLHFRQGGIVGDIPLVGIGFDPSTRTYKVVRIFRYRSSSERNNNKCSMRCEVYTLVGGGGGGCSSWRYISEVPISPYAFNLLDNFPVVVNDAIHWIIRRQHYCDKPVAKTLLSFSVKNETFSLIPLPKGFSTTCLSSSLLEIEGFLSVYKTHLSAKKMDIWMLKDYDNHEWVKQYSINLRTMHKWSVYYGTRAKPVTVRDGKIVFCAEEGRMDYYDLESNTFVEHEMLFVNRLCCAPYIGSLMWPEDTVAMQRLQLSNTSNYNDRS